MKKKVFVFSTALFLLSFSFASAHVTVKPGEAGVGSFQTFTVSVPSEKAMATTQVRLVMPEGLEHVSPTVKPGWRVEMKRVGNEHEAMVSEITWRGGSIPEHFRDEFTFSAKVPSKPVTLTWKAYQTYSDGSVVSWELMPGAQQPTDAEGKADFSKTGPASQTKVIDDLSGNNMMQKGMMNMDYVYPYDWLIQPRTLLVISLLSLILSLITLVMGLQRNTNKKR